MTHCVPNVQLADIEEKQSGKKCAVVFCQLWQLLLYFETRYRLPAHRLSSLIIGLTLHQIKHDRSCLAFDRLEQFRLFLEYLTWSIQILKCSTSFYVDFLCPYRVSYILSNRISYGFNLYVLGDVDAYIVSSTIPCFVHGKDNLILLMLSCSCISYHSNIQRIYLQ